MNSFLRELYIYPGRSEDHDYKAYKLQNTLIEGSEWRPTLNNLIVRLIQESNPNELEIIPYLGEESIWSNVEVIQERYKKILPQIRHCYSAKTSSEVLSVIKRVYTDLHSLTTKHTLAEKNIVYIINGNVEFTQVESDELSSMVSYIKDYGAANGYYIMFVGDKINPTLQEICSLFVYTIGSESAQADLKKGMAEVVDENYYTLVYIPFYPDTFLTKFMRYYSMNVRE